jgi:hypothetical protein
MPQAAIRRQSEMDAVWASNLNYSRIGSFRLLPKDAMDVRWQVTDKLWRRPDNEGIIISKR